MAAPNYDNVQWPGAGGLRIPTEGFGLGGPGNPCGTIDVAAEVDINVGGSGTTNTINLTAQQSIASYVTVTNGGTGATTIKWPACQPGSFVVVFNNTAHAQTCTFMVTGKTGVAVADGKRAILVFDKVAGDLVRVTADT